MTPIPNESADIAANPGIITLHAFWIQRNIAHPARNEYR